MAFQQVNLVLCFVFLSMTIDQFVNSTTATHRHSGFYVDNGDDQTVIHQLTTEMENLAYEREILKLLGFPDKPKDLSSRAPLRKRSAPKFLLNVYKNSMANGYEKTKTNRSDQVREEFFFSGHDLRLIDESDAIITFTAQQNHHGLGGKPDRVKRIWFDVASVPAENQLTSAELRLYRGPDAKNRKNRGAFVITVYQVLRTKDGNREMQVVDSIDTSAGQEGWLTLNITETLQNWMENPGDNKGLYLSVHPANRSSHETRPEDIGIVGFKGDVELQPFMAGFFKNTESTNSVNLIQPKFREIEASSKRNQKRYASDIRDLLKNNNTIQGSSRPCKVSNLYVSFKDLEWQDWIIAPSGYDANYCSGECKFPLNTQMNATNHAIIQTLVHLLDPQKVPKPCCAPTELSPISVVYFLDENTVIHKKYKDMVVRGCGCH